MATVWYVIGDEDMVLWAYKEMAEMWARHLFPDEDADTRYSRIRFKSVHTGFEGE